MITQLRHARKSNQEDASTAIAERETHKQLLEKQEQELSELRSLKTKYVASEQHKETIHDDLLALQTQSQITKVTYEKRIQLLEEQLEDIQRQLAQVERLKYEVESQLEASVSDLMISRHELAMRTQELSNLHLALNNLEQESDSRLQVIKNDHQHNIVWWS